MPWNPQRLTVLITGSSSGLGLALTRNILSHGHHVIATSRTPAKTPDLVAEVEAAGGQWLALDLDDPDCGAVIARLEDQGTHVDVLTNAAGFSILGASEAFAEDEVRRQMETSFFGPYRLMRAVVPRMRERRRGMIVNLSSGAGCYGREAMAIYGASKSAMDALIRIMGKETAPFNIRTLNVVLGGFNTNFTKAASIARTEPPADYQGSQLRTNLSGLKSGYKPEGDPAKAAQAIYEMIAGEGVGEGKEAETVLYLGRDIWRVMNIVTGATSHALEASRDVCNNVYLDE